jgi:hypothetical protein
VCIRDETLDASWCDAGVLDTGNTHVYIKTYDAGGLQDLPDGDIVQIVIGDQPGCTFDYSFEASSSATNVVQLLVVDAGPYVNIGTQAFFRYSVIFDPWGGTVTLVPQ